MPAEIFHVGNATTVGMDWTYVYVAEAARPVGVYIGLIVINALRVPRRIFILIVCYIARNKGARFRQFMYCGGSSRETSARSLLWCLDLSDPLYIFLL